MTLCPASVFHANTSVFAILSQQSKVTDPTYLIIWGGIIQAIARLTMS